MDNPATPITTTASSTTVDTPKFETPVINIPSQSSSPRSPRLAHLRPPTSPLTPEAMRRIHLLSVQDPHVAFDPSKLSPISPAPSITTSDLGSSPRSSISITTPSFTWSMYRDSKKSSSDFTDVDSDMCKDLLSPSITLSPAPFSPFSDHPAGTISEPTWTPSRQRLHFSFDPKSPSFIPLTSSGSSHFLLPPPPTFGGHRERSRSDCDSVLFESRDDERLTSPSATGESTDKLSGSESGASGETVLLVPPKTMEGQKHLYKKRLLRKYEEEKVGPGSDTGAELAGTSMDDDMELDEKPSAPKSCRPTLELCYSKSVNLPTVQESSLLPPASPQPLVRCLSSISDYGAVRWPETTSAVSFAQATPASSLTTPVESVRLPLRRAEEQRPLLGPADFDMWLRRQLMAVNQIWYPPPTSMAMAPEFRARRDSQGVGPLFGPLLPMQPPGPIPLHPFHRPSPIYSSPLYQPPLRHRPSVHPAPIASVAQLTFSRRSRSESDVSYECQHCGQSFSLRDRLAKHVASRHREHGAAGTNTDSNATKSHKCTVCQKYFGRSDMLTRHMRLHTGIRPYICHTCGQVFSRSDHLSTHQRTHTGEKPYQCPMCPYAASRRDMITRHMRTHSRSSDDPSTSGIGNVSAIEKALNQTMLSSDDPELAKLEIYKRSPDTESDRGSGGSSGSTNTVLCVDDEESYRKFKTEPEDSDEEPR